jgi:hypothetical protein
MLVVKRNNTKEIKELKGKLAIIHKHLKKRPISKKHEEFLIRRLTSTIQEISELEQSELYYTDLSKN